MKKNLSIYITILFVTAISCQNNDHGSNHSNIDSTSKLSQLMIRNKETNSQTSYELKNDSIQIRITFQRLDSLSINFNCEIQKLNGVKKLNGLAHLIRLENDDGTFYVPEETPILDENTNKEYSCDSTYSYDSKKISLGFGFEQKDKRRLSFTIDNSIIKMVSNHDYTLYKIN